MHAQLDWPPSDLPPYLRDHVTRWAPGAVMRLLDAERRVLARHQLVECNCGNDWHTILHTRLCSACETGWPCDPIRDLADRLGINTEESP